MAQDVTIKLRLDGGGVVASEIQSVESALAGMGKQAQDTGKKAEGMGRMFKDAMAFISVGVIAHKFKEVATETERLRGMLVTVTGDAQKAGTASAPLTYLAPTTPFPLHPPVEAFISFAGRRFVAPYFGPVLANYAVDYLR